MRQEKFIPEFSRRRFLQGFQYAPVLFLPAPIRAFAAGIPGAFALADVRVAPHYAAKSSLDDMLRLVTPGSDQFIAEKYAFEIEGALQRCAHELLSSKTSLSSLQQLTVPALRASSLRAKTERKKRAGQGLTVLERQFSTALDLGREQFLEELREYFASMARIVIAEFQVVGIREQGTSPVKVEATIRYSFVGESAGGSREQRIGHWQTEWIQVAPGAWNVQNWQAVEETASRAQQTFFTDVSEQAFGALLSYQQQLRYGADHWRTVLDGASGVDVYGNQGIAVGDYDGDGFDDVYICQPSGLPNRLYRNRGDGTFDDVTASSGLDVLDATSCALFADFDNQGKQDLLVVTSGGPLLFVNQGQGKFVPKHDAFKFVRPPQGTFTHAAIADYDHDNDRYSFACAWGDYNSNGWPDLYVANDFGRSNLYRNNGNGTFSSIATEAGVEDVGAGMSACWLDFDGDGNQDIYVANMWSAAGLRISTQERFHAEDPGNVRAMYRRHARGNSLYRNQGDGKFRNAAAETGTEFGRWAWSSDSWDFDHDGHPDLCIANGYVSGTQGTDLSSFFWRQVVGNSPRTFAAAPHYENGWNAINELIRSDRSWSGYERNVFYCNNRDGTFSDVSGISGIDMPDDSRAFALADLDHDGRLEILLKNRNAPQLRLLRNQMSNIGNSVAFRLRGTKSNRDAIGAAITLDAGGRRQTKYLQAGSGFLSQHTKDIFFGVAEVMDSVKITVRWPSGAVQNFPAVPVNHRIDLVEGSVEFQSQPFSRTPEAYLRKVPPQVPATEPQSVATWLLQPLRAPGFSLRDTPGKEWDLHSLSGNKLITFWASASDESREQLRLLSKQNSAGVQVLAVNLDVAIGETGAPSRVASQNSGLPMLVATEEVAGVYNIVFRYLFDRHRDLGVPTSLLVDGSEMIVKIYQGLTNPGEMAADLKTLPRDREGRRKRDLGTLFLRRKDLDRARTHLQKAAELKPNYPEAWNNLGMLAAEQGKADEAVENFKQSLALRPEYSVALLNLGNLLRRQKSFREAADVLNRAFQADPGNPEVSYALGMLHAQQNEIADAKESFQRALGLRPGYPDALNNFGVLLVREQKYADAEKSFQSCIQSNPDFDQAYLNLARLYVLLHDKARAREVLQSLLRQQPGHRMAQQALEMLQ